MKSVVSGIFIPSWLAREYTFREKSTCGVAGHSLKFGLWDKLLRTDLTTAVPTLELPVYFFHGQYDYLLYDLARQYFRQLNAPLKGFYVRALSPLPRARSRKGAGILRQDVLAGSTLADAT